MNIIKILKNRFLKQLFAFVLIVVAYESVIYRKEYYFWIMTLFLFLTIVVLLWLINFKVKNKELLKIIVLPFLLITASSSFLFLIPSKSFTHIYAFTVAILITYFLGRVISQTSRKLEFEELYNLNDIVTLVTAFLFYSSLYGFFIQLYLKPWIFLIIFAVFTSLLLYRFLDREKQVGEWVGMILPISTLVFTEIAWALTFWPVGYATRGIVFLLLLYIFIGAIKLSMEGNLGLKNIRKYIFVLVAVLGLVLGTTKWFY